MNPQELLDTYHSNVQAFIKAAKAISPDKMNTQSAPDQWSAAFIIHHMADAELQFGVRFANTLVEDNPAIVPFDEEKFPIGLQYEKRNPQISLMAFEAAHNLNYEVLNNASVEDWNRTSVHPDKGLVHLTSLVKLCGGHIGTHIEQLKDS
jgi:hypothetical protein